MDAKFKKHRLFSDNEDHFVIDDGETQFKVAKYMIDPRTKKKIESMERHEKFACGGEVKGYYNGDEVGMPEDVSRQAIPDDVFNKAKDVASGKGKDVAVDMAKKYAESSLPPGLGVPTPGDYSPRKAASAIAGDLETAKRTADAIKRAEELGAAEQAAVDAGRELTNRRVEAAGKGYEAPGYTVPEKPSVLLPTPTTAKQKGIGLPGQGPQQPTQPAIGEDPYKGFIDAGEKYTKSVESAGKAAADLYGGINKQLAAVEEKNKDMYTALEGNIKSLTKEIQDGKIDPNRYWTNLQAPNKILAAVSIILGGLGPSGKNEAMEVINKQVEQDVEAQKANLNNKNSLLSRNLEMLGTLREAEQATKAQIYAGIGAQVSGLNAAALGPKARMEQAELVMKTKLMAQQMNKEVSRAYAVRSLEGLEPTPATPQQLSLAGKDYDARAVKLPGDTGYLTAGTPEAATEINTQLAQNQAINDLLDEIERISGGASYGFTERDRVGKLMSKLEILVSKREGASQAKESTIKTMRGMLDDPRGLANLFGASSAHSVQDLKDALRDETESLMGQNVRGYKKVSPYEPKPKK